MLVVKPMKKLKNFGINNKIEIMEKNNDKANEYNNLLREHDRLDYEISKLRATNGGINLSEQIEKEIHELQLKKEQISLKIIKMF